MFTRITKAYAKAISAKSKKESDLFFKKHLLKGTDTMYLTLKIHLYVERVLNNILTKCLVNPERILQSKFSQKVNIVDALGILSSETIRKLRVLDQIRNNYSHELDYELTTKDLDLLENKKRRLPKSLRIRTAGAYLIGLLDVNVDMLTGMPFVIQIQNQEKLFKDDPFFAEAKIKLFSNTKWTKKIKLFLDNLVTSSK